MLLIGMIGVPAFAWQLRCGAIDGDVAGVGWRVRREQQPVIFWMAMAMNACLVGGSLLLIYMALQILVNLSNT
jgi:hypothetical protein